MCAAVDRRDFLRWGAGAGLGLMSAVHATAQEAGGGVDRIRVGVMGVNGRGAGLAEGFARQESVQIAYVCDVDSRVTAPVVEALGKIQGVVPQVVGDMRRILDDPAVDVLVVAAPNHWHAPATILACAAGKHVYVEKPCSHTPEEGEWAVAAAREHRRVVTTGTQRRSWVPIMAAMDQLHRGAIGSVLFARTWYRSLRPSIGRGQIGDPPSGLDYELWQGPAPRRPYKNNLIHYNWHWHWHWGNGELGNNGVHALDLARWGMQVEFPTRVLSSGGRYRYEDDQETPDTHLVTYEFGSRAITWEGLSWSPRGPAGSAFGVTFHGEEGTLELFDKGYRIYDMQNKLVAEQEGQGGDDEHIVDFLRCVRHGGLPTADIEIGHRSALLCHLGNISHRLQRALATDPASGRPRDDPAALELWSREYAPGWRPQV
ncbi:MAG: Gfo/Idh/MocA family oxidoreductase [Pirellulaceae bacterium]|nr:Gfo/Idh/MocA family oxidoreductase [Pirellulaceae bacterium]